MGTEENSIQVVEMAVDFGYVNRSQAQAAIARQIQLQNGGVSLSVAQVLLERRFLTPAKLKRVIDAVRQKSGLAKAVGEEKPIGKIAQFTILSELDRAGNARVFRARDMAMQRPVLLKLLPKELKNDPQWSERFKREMILAAKLQHPNIITTYTGGDVEGHMIISMEYVSGISLAAKLEREGNVPEKIAWLIAREVAKALAHAAQHGILHRNINPKAIFCGDDGKVKLGEFGLSKALTDQSNLTSAGTTVGSVFYISPEQARGTDNLDPRTDIYSLGCTVFHMLTGSFPFINQSTAEVMQMHTRAPRPDAHDILPEIGIGSSELVKRMMAIEMAERPSSAEALIAQIGLLLPMLPDPEECVRKLDQPFPSDAEVPVELRPPDKRKTSFMLKVAVPPAPIVELKRGMTQRLMKWLRGA